MGYGQCALCSALLLLRRRGLVAFASTLPRDPATRFTDRPFSQKSVGRRMLHGRTGFLSPRWTPSAPRRQGPSWVSSASASPHRHATKPNDARQSPTPIRASIRRAHFERHASCLLSDAGCISTSAPPPFSMPLINKLPRMMQTRVSWLIISVLGGAGSSRSCETVPAGTQRAPVPFRTTEKTQHRYHRYDKPAHTRLHHAREFLNLLHITSADRAHTCICKSDVDDTKGR